MDIKIGQLWQDSHDPERIYRVSGMFAVIAGCGVVIKADNVSDEALCIILHQELFEDRMEMIPEKWEPKNPPPTEHPCEVYFTDRTKANFGRCKNTAIAKYTVDGVGMKMNLCQSCAVNIYGYKAKIIGEPH